MNESINQSTTSNPAARAGEVDAVTPSGPDRPLSGRMLCQSNKLFMLVITHACV